MSNSSATWDKILAHARKETFAGDGYVIELAQPWAVRYKADGKVLTVPQDPVPKRTDNHWWTIFTGYYLAFYLESPVTWDDEEEPMGVGEAETVLGRIADYLDSRLGKNKYRLFIGKISHDDRSYWR